MPRGFILHPTYYLEKGRAVVHLFGRLETGETFVVREDRHRPYFWIRTRDLPAARRGASFACRETEWTTPKGEPVSRVYVSIPAQAPPLRDSLHAVGIPT